MDTFVLRFLESVDVTLAVNQFWTAVIFKTPQSDITSSIMNRKNEIFCLFFLKSIPQATAQANKDKMKSPVEKGSV